MRMRIEDMLLILVITCAILAVIVGLVTAATLLVERTRRAPTCTVERVTFPASAKECARIHKAIERRIANEAT